jgi:hypothetical protein
MAKGKDRTRIICSIRNNNLDDEKAWTYLLAKAYQHNVSELVFRLCGRRENISDNSSIYLEARLYPTREKRLERKYWISIPDLSVGCLKKYTKRERQLQSDGEWFCVVESKWFDDFRELDLKEFDRNNELPKITQFTKLIDHALLLNDGNGNFPDRIYVTLITPKYFKENYSTFPPKNYRRIYCNYDSNGNLKEDLKRCTIPFLDKSHDNVYNTMVERINYLILNWVTFEDLLGLNNLVVGDPQNKKAKTDRDSWEQVLKEMKREDLIEELLTENK